MPQPDDMIIALLEDLAACLCTELAEMAGEDDPPGCICQPIPGSFPATTYLPPAGADAGWVRLVTDFPSNIPGQQSIQPFNMNSGLSLMVEIGVTRCGIAVDARSMPTAAGLYAAWVQQMRDRGAIQRAIECCTGKSWDDNQLVQGNYVPYGPDGQTYGGLLSLVLQIE